MVGVFLPISSALDKTDRAPSSFANTVMKLRSRTGRIDPALAAHAAGVMLHLWRSIQMVKNLIHQVYHRAFVGFSIPLNRLPGVVVKVEDTITVTELAKRVSMRQHFLQMLNGGFLMKIELRSDSNKLMP